MTINVLFAARQERWDTYERPLKDAFSRAGLTADLRTDFAPAEVDYIVYAPNSDVQDFTPFVRLKAVLNLWAGVEAVVGNKTLTVPLTRMVDHGMTQGMREWVTGHVLRHHLGLDRYLHGQDGTWRPGAPPLAQSRRVTVLGLGELGRACAETLAFLGFDIAGWSRTQKSVAGLLCLSGEDGLQKALERADILVLLLPDTTATRNVLDAKAMAQLPQGAVILNPGRGTLIDDEALLDAVGTGQIAHATLDVFRTEPLPKDHPFWHHPNITVTPHIASETRPETACAVIAENVRRGAAGEALLHVVDRQLGY
ncbi:glyoxylate/hydroxypyruvate reductase A [Thalassococcus sp. S3]|uniref:2-hydroxyacid dehydrogenase n=1 Tax=Thalassococcus sp. S3 TaxID=2017482 RepID=UPI001023FBFA|nr:glyoxylate/hydroxypyruvate reductase A [Thalassococcus sp. S3]QBF30257.1 glyoxylate/hydroxypyruvate reductase A [Thalassococcus sp. S3]